MLTRVMLVDDEPFILQGLSVIIDWEAEGYEIVKRASDGEEALAYLEGNEVDLIITDIRMPKISGLELLERIRTENLSDAYVIILSGYNDFKYAQTALRYSCMDYLLKPIQKEQLLENLGKVSAERAFSEKEETDNMMMRRGYLLQNLSALLQGRADEKKTAYVRGNLRCTGKMNYIHISLGDLSVLEEMSDDEVAVLRDKVYEAAVSYIGVKENVFRDFFMIEEEYEVGFLFCDSMAHERGMNMDDYLVGLHKTTSLSCEGMPVMLLVGKEVSEVSRLSLSYSSACRLRSFRGLGEGKNVYYYEEEIQAHDRKTVLCKQALDDLVAAVVSNDADRINAGVDELFAQIDAAGRSKDILNMNINYLVFRFMDLATEQDETINQGEVLSYIGGGIFNDRTDRSSRLRMKKFAAEYADYLAQVQKNKSGGVLSEIESEIREHYAENLTLKELGQKYYINSSYLGQMFRKRYGQSFKNYLNACRIKEAANQLIKTDKKIAQIAEDVGYHDLDYFISRFIEVYDCTPARYRKSGGAGI